MEMELKSSASPIDNGKRPPWPLKDILYGFSIPLAFFVIIYTLDHVDSIRYRPWIAGPFSIALGISAYIGLFLCAVHICRKRGLWPLIVSPSGFAVCKEFMKSLLALLLIMLAVGFVGNLLSTILKIQ